jgi:hypothetical protein
MLNLVVHKVTTKLERVKNLNFIFAPKYYTFTLEGFRENSDLFTRVPQILNGVKFTVLDNIACADTVASR